jgi:hypothetical protein
VTELKNSVLFDGKTDQILSGIFEFSDFAPPVATLLPRHREA